MKKVKKYIGLFAIFLVGASPSSPSLKVVEKNNPERQPLKAFKGSSRAFEETKETSFREYMDNALKTDSAQQYTTMFRYLKPEELLKNYDVFTQTNAREYMDVFNNPELQKIYDVFTELFLNLKKNLTNAQNPPDSFYLKNPRVFSLFLGFALKCSLLPKNSSLQDEECEKLLKEGIKARDFAKKDIDLYQSLLKRLQNLDAKNVIDVIVPNVEGIGAPRYIAYGLAEDLIPLALHRGKREDARYFYEKVTQHVTKASMRAIDESFYRGPYFREANMINMRLIKHAVEYENADTIIQDLLGAPYSITQKDMDCAFLERFHNYFPVTFYTDEIYRLFLNNTMKPSLEAVKEAMVDCEPKWRSVDSSYADRGVDLQMDFLRFFIALREKQSDFDFNGVFKKLSANVEEFPALGKILDRILNDYLEGKIPTNKNSSITAFEDYKNTRGIPGDNPKIKRAVTNQFNIGRGTPTGFKVSQLAKDLTLQIQDGRTNLNSQGAMGVIMQYVDPSAQHISTMSDKGAEKLKEERGKIMAQTKAENAQKVAPNQNDNVQIDTMQPGEVHIDTMQKLKDNSLDQ
jgi:hypothetical protein